MKQSAANIFFILLLIAVSFNAKSQSSNLDQLNHYRDLVTKDSLAYTHQIPDSVTKIIIAQHFNSLAWYSIVTLQLNRVEYELQQSIRFDPGSKYPYANMPLLFLLQGHYQKAKALYLKYKDKPFEGPKFTFKDEFLLDFNEMEQAGVINKNFRKIRNLLNR